MVECDSLMLPVHLRLPLNPAHTSNNGEATLSNTTESNVASTMSNVASTLLPFLGNNVEATFDFVAKTATMSNQFFVKFRNFDMSKQIEHV